jgi:signal transduction histidine kinase/ligand-binding sensor domain-containing protein
MFTKISKIYDKNKCSFKAVFILFLFFTAPSKSFAKAILYEGRDGLSSNDISAIAKDNRGLMWIGTYNGLNIYDGYTFTKLQGELSNLHITTLAINNSKHELLVGTNLGLYSVDLSTLKVYKLIPQHKSLGRWSNNKVNAICIFPGTKEVFASFEKGCLAKINKNRRLELVCRLNDTTRSINYIVPGDSNNLIISNGDIYNVDLKFKSGSRIKAFENTAPFNSISRSGNILLINGYNSKLSMLESKTFNDITPKVLYGEKKPFPYHVLQSQLKNNKLYILSDNYTFVIVDITTGYIDEISKKYPDIFEGKAYYFLFIDEHDIIWIATNKGLIKVEERPELFTKELSNLPARVSTRKMIEDANGDIYVSSYIGLWHYSKQARSWNKYNQNTDEVIKANPAAFENPVQPLALLPIPGSTYLYLGFDSDKLLRFDKRKKVFEKINYTTEHKGNEIKGIYTLIQDKKGTVWIGCGNGLASYDPKQNRLSLHRRDAFDIGDDRVRYIIEDVKRNLIYVASTSGLHIIDIEKGVIGHLNQFSRPALTSNDILYVGQDNEHKLWLGTNGGGINILSSNLKSVQYIHKQDGLSSEIVYGIVPQDDSTYWISTFNGLDRYRKDLKSFSNFFEEDGLSSNEFNQNSFLKTSDGKMYFGSINGMTSFYPKLFNLSVPFNIYLSGISQWDDKTQTVQLIRNKIVSDNILVKRPSDLLYELHFACTDYSDPLRNSYSYRIKELADNWISLEDRHTLNVGGIPYGTYTLEVKAINSRGASSENILLFHIIVTQPFYKTWWFFALILTGLAIIFYAAYLFKSQSFKNILHLRMKIASNLHDEVGSLLTRITMFSDNLRYSKNTEEQRNIKLEKIAVLSRDAIASMSDVLWAIDSRNDFAGNLLDRMREHTEEMLFPLGIDVNFVLSGTDLKQPISSDMRGELYLIFKEAINNIARHSEATKVDILYHVTDKSFLLNITNNGATEDISELSTGQGLSNMKMRAAKAGAKIQVKKEDGTFSVEIKN